MTTEQPRTVQDVGEFGLIDRISLNLAGRTGSVVAGVGDDTAALRPTPGRLLLATCDVQVERVHFNLDTTTPELLGRKCLAVNLSDVAAMGGVPRFALVSLGLPKDTPLAVVDGLYAGLRSIADEFDVDVVGGNVSSTPRGIFVDVTVLGEVEPDRVLYRSGARVGDLLIVTGHPGDSAGGLALLLDPEAVCPHDAAERLKAAHRAPVPRVKAGRAIASTGLAHAMIDLSDGLAGDLGHVAAASGVGAILWEDELPLSASLRAAAVGLGRDPLDLALHGGEDYELLVATPRDAADEVLRAIRSAGIDAAVVGEVVPAEQGLSIRGADGALRPLVPVAYRHF